jgi:hypothetical protein
MTACIRRRQFITLRSGVAALCSGAADGDAGDRIFAS